MPLWAALILIVLIFITPAVALCAFTLSGRADDATDKLADELPDGDWPHVPDGARPSDHALALRAEPASGLVASRFDRSRKNGALHPTVISAEAQQDHA